MQLKNGIPIEMDCRMPELAENAPVQGLVRKNKRMRRILIFCVVSLVNGGLLALLLTQLLTPAQHGVPDPLVGHPAPDCSLAMLRPGSGKSSLSLSNFKGKPVVLNFWASWCAPCKEEMPLLESTWKQVQGKDVVFLGVDFQDSNRDRKSTRLNSSHQIISYAVFCLKKKTTPPPSAMHTRVARIS